MEQEELAQVDYDSIEEFLELRGNERRDYRFDPITVKFINKFIRAYNKKIRSELKLRNYNREIREIVYMELLDMLNDEFWCTLYTHIMDCIEDENRETSAEGVFEGDIYKLISCKQIREKLR